jgi:NAD-dependent SIR2 family protein deacetylase
MSGDGWKQMPDQPKVCEVCGKPVRLNKDTIWFQTSEPKRTWHWQCRMAAKLTPSAPSV